MTTKKAVKKKFTNSFGEYAINTLSRELYTQAMSKDLLRLSDKDFHKECEVAAKRARAAANIFYFNGPDGKNL